MSKQIEFNKENALDKLGEIMKPTDNNTISDSIKSLINAQNFLQEIHDNAFNKGFEKGCDATNKINEI